MLVVETHNPPDSSVSSGVVMNSCPGKHNINLTEKTTSATWPSSDGLG